MPDAGVPRRDPAHRSGGPLDLLLPAVSAMRLLAAIVGLFAALACTPAAAKPPMWTVRDANSTIVIFGSVHLLPPGLDWTPPELTAALAKADDVWFELPITDAAADESIRLTQLRGSLPADDS